MDNGEMRAIFINYAVTIIKIILKEYYEIVGESRPLSAFFPKQVDFVTEMHS